MSYAAAPMDDAARFITDLPEFAAHGVRAGFTARAGGVSLPPYASLNLGFHVGDDDAAVAENLRRAAAGLGIKPEMVCYLTQVHGTAVCEVTGPVPGGRVGLADAMVTKVPGLALMVRTADCLPLLLCDPVRKAVAAVHAGRRGTFANIAAVTVSYLVRHHGCRAGDLLAAIGPAAGRCCYAVNTEALAELRAARPDDADEFIGSAADGQPTIDLAGINRAQLLAAGLADANLAMHSPCTICDPRFFSYRRDGVTGRQAAMIMLRG